MAIFRKIHTTFWSDSFVSELNQKQKLFYIYILTNDKTKQCGVYQITKKQICFDLDCSMSDLTTLIQFFIKKDKIRYNEETNEIAIKNWGKYNDASSPKVKACINKELNFVKDNSLISYTNNSTPHGGNYNPNYRVSKTTREFIFKRDLNKCTLCGSESNLSIDHIIPRNIGGLSINENLRCLCRSCNSSRSLFGEELKQDLTNEGYDFDKLLNINKIDNYQYSIRINQYSIGTQSQEEEEEEQEEEREQEEKKETAFLSDVLNSEYIAVLNLWLQHKKERKENYKETGLKTLAKKIKEDYKTVEDFESAVKYSISNNWAGIYPPKKQPQQQSSFNPSKMVY